jgi:hypothetical protein
MDHAAIMGMRKVMAEAVTDWMPDGGSPPNFVRETGMGRCFAKVDVRCGGYQWPHTPIVIGWKVQKANTVEYGMVIVADHAREGDKPKDTVARAIQFAKDAADAAWEKVSKAA